MRFNLVEKAKNITQSSVDYNDNFYQLQVKELAEKGTQLSELVKQCQKICDNLGIPFVLVVPDSVAVSRESAQTEEDKKDNYYESSWQSSGC